VEPSFEEARETYAARRVLEPGMLRDAGKPLQSAIRQLRAHVAKEHKSIATADAAARSVLLADFHVCLAECLGNRLLTNMAGVNYLVRRRRARQRQPGGGNIPS
jgi:DNA-binding GntR family transcriptional regulator